MNLPDKSKTYKEDELKNKFYKFSKDNLEYYERKNTWLVENYNSISRNISDRLSALVGISIGLLPLIFQYLKPESSREISIIVFILVFLVISIIAGNIDSMLCLHFWNKNIEKNILAIRLWNSSTLEMSKSNTDNAEKIYNMADQGLAKLKLNEKLKVLEIPFLLQIVTAICAIVSQVFYLYIKI